MDLYLLLFLLMRFETAESLSVSISLKPLKLKQQQREKTWLLELTVCCFVVAAVAVVVFLLLPIDTPKPSKEIGTLLLYGPKQRMTRQQEFCLFLFGADHFSLWCCPFGSWTTAQVDGLYPFSI